MASPKKIVFKSEKQIFIETFKILQLFEIITLEKNDRTCEKKHDAIVEAAWRRKLTLIKWYLCITITINNSRPFYKVQCDSVHPRFLLRKLGVFVRLLNFGDLEWIISTCDSQSIKNEVKFVSRSRNLCVKRINK